MSLTALHTLVMNKSEKINFVIQWCKVTVALYFAFKFRTTIRVKVLYSLIETIFPTCLMGK
ncbi:hypothetical protein CF135_15215 [Aeromonas veronii]|nr:hypothetical protein CF135_15215 [Aeromonas veronii]